MTRARRQGGDRAERAPPAAHAAVQPVPLLHPRAPAGRCRLWEWNSLTWVRKHVCITTGPTQEGIYVAGFCLQMLQKNSHLDASTGALLSVSQLAWPRVRRAEQQRSPAGLFTKEPNQQ